MRALRGDLFEITDEDPLALAADEADPSDPFVTAAADEPYVDEPRPRVPAPAARNPKRLGWRRARWVLCAALICAAAAGVAALGARESPQRGNAQHATPGARVPDRPVRRGPAQPPRRQRQDRRTAPRESIQEPLPEDDVAMSTADRGPAANPSAPIGVSAERSLTPDAVGREFGFER